MINLANFEMRLPSRASADPFRNQFNRIRGRVAGPATRSKPQSCRSRGHETHLFPPQNRKKPVSPHVVSYFLKGLLGVALILVLGGCGKSDDDSGKITATNPKEAASQLERAFANSNPDTKQNADVVSDALRKGDYERAVVSLQAVRSGSNLTLEQGLAIHSSIVTLESKLITAMESGDENAKKAYELLKQFKRH